MPEERCPWCWWVGENPCVSMADAAACTRESAQERCGVTRGDGSIPGGECALPAGHEGEVHYG